jgi:hypothetical protein
MQGRAHYIFGGIFLIIVAIWWFAEHEPRPDVPAAVSEAGAANQPQQLSDAEVQRQFAAMEQDKQSVAEELSRRAADQGKRARAGAKTVEYRKVIQANRAPEWTAFIRAHWPTYKSLRSQAAAHHDGQTPCTICDGRGSVESCFLCKSSGKCQTCKGTGKLELSSDELCPSCLGTGKCYLCAGTGKMICPFCEDGRVDIKLPLVPGGLPVENISPSFNPRAPVTVQ